MLLTLPVLTTLGNFFGTIETSFIGRRDIGTFLTATRICDLCFDFDEFRFSWFYSPHLELPEKLIRFLEAYDAGAFFINTDKAILKTKTNTLFKKGLWLQPSIPPVEFKGHIVDYHLSLFVGTEVIPYRQFPKFKLPPSNKRFPAPYFVIHPGSGSPKKNMPLEKFLEIADIQSLELKAKPVFLIGPAERSSEFRELTAQNVVYDNLDLIEAAHLLVNSLHYYGNDSGITHLAALLGIPTTAFFKNDNIQRWSPWGKQVRVLTFESSVT